MIVIRPRPDPRLPVPPLLRPSLPGPPAAVPPRPIPVARTARSRQSGGFSLFCLSGTLKVQPLSRFLPLGHLGLAVVIVSFSGTTFMF